MTSRYAAVEIAETAVPDGAGGTRTVRYLRRRGVPGDPAVPALAYHRVVEGDRLDVIAARYLGDPFAYWRIADAAKALDADAVTATPGAVVAIPGPEF